VRLCRSPWEQLRGLIGYAPPPSGAGIALPGCAAVHTAFVRYPIDVLFLRDGHVIAIAASLFPWRIARGRGADMAIELAAGSARSFGLRVGDSLELRVD
jgi:hypothetical protein